MIRFAYLLLFPALLLQIRCEPGRKAQVVEKQQDHPASTTHTLTGFNAEYMTDVCLDGTLDVANKEFKNVHLHADCDGVVQALDPEVIRWPGGITANYYHFKGSGYGFKREEVKGTEYEGNPERLQELLDVNFIDLFIEMARGRKVVFTANLLTGTLEENLQAIRYLQASDVELIGVELGNEFYYSRMSPEEYLQRCQPFIDAIHDVKLAVHMAPDFGVNALKWNQTVASADVDAVAIHEYNRKIINNCKQKDDAGYYACAVEMVDDFTGNYMDFLVRSYRKKYGMKELWLTEWNVAPQTRDVYGTYIQAYNNFKMLNNFHALDLEMALFHNLVTGGSMYPVATRKNEQLTYNPDFYVHKMMPRGEYHGKGQIGVCQLWYYADGVAIANPTDQKVAIDPSQFPGGQTYVNFEVLVSENLGARPVYSSGKLSGITIPPYSLAVLK